ncbi:MAG: hypothetical protein ACXVZX_00665 [Terriglobales bacterium]
MAAVFVATLPVIAHTEERAPKAGTQVENPTLDDIVNRMEEARLRNKTTPPFQLTREYKMFHGDEPNPSSDVKAEINVVPPYQRDFRILDSKGNDRGEKVVRKILEHEAQAEKVTPSPTGITRDNYDFSLAGRQAYQGVNCYVLNLKPKRQEPSLIEGQAWVDPETFAVRKIEGKMAKSPSWWVKDVNLVINFGDMGGIWMQTASHAVADVRVVGKYTVVGRALEVQTADSVASNRALQKKVFDRRHTGLPAVFVYGGTDVTRR